MLIQGVGKSGSPFNIFPDLDDHFPEAFVPDLFGDRVETADQRDAGFQGGSELAGKNYQVLGIDPLEDGQERFQLERPNGVFLALDHDRRKTLLLQLERHRPVVIAL